MFREIFEFSPIAIVIADRSERIHLINTQAETLFGYQSVDLIGHPLEKLIPEIFSINSPPPFQDRNLLGHHKDGTEIPIAVTLKSIQTEDGLFFLSSIVDQTHRIRAEEKFRAAFEASPNPMIMVDRAGLIVLANDVALQLFGYTESELLKQPITILVPESIRSRHPALVEKFMESPSSRPMGNSRVLHARKKDGRLFPVEIGLRPFHGQDGLYVLSSIVDLSEIMRIRQSLVHRNQELQQFTYRTSHDLKAPLISIHGLARYVREDIASGNVNEALQCTDRIIALSARLQTTITTILDLMRAENLDDPVLEVDFHKIAVQCRESLQTQAEERRVRLEFEFDHSANLKTQTTRITQIIENLVSNGVKYSDSEKSDRYVRVKTHEEGAKLILSVEDNGLGIPPSRHSEVFSIFKRFHASSTQGSGLGLYLVKIQVERLGGEISFVSSEQGTRFQVTIPISD